MINSLTSSVDLPTITFDVGELTDDVGDLTKGEDVLKHGRGDRHS